MSSVDDRVVNMQFNNAEFEKRMGTTMNSLDKLKSSLNFNGAGRGLEGISAGVENISSKFSALGAIGFTALQSLTNSAIGFAKKIGGSLLDPIVEGGKKRALNIEQAKFMLDGLGVSWNSIKDDILYGVKDTAYGLDEAAKAASSLAASQVKVGGEMKTALRGISGVAAMTGSSYSDIADVFTKVAGQGRLMGDDLLRMSSRGLNAAAILGKSMGKSEADVRKMVTAGKIDFKTFATAMDSAFGKHAKDANKTFEGALSNMKAALARIGADVATPAFENLRKIFNALTPQIDAFHNALLPVINLLAEGMGSATKAIVKFIKSFGVMDFDKVATGAKLLWHVVEEIQTLFQNLAPIFKAVGDAFSQVFPPATAYDIREILIVLDKFVESIKMGDIQLWELRRAMAGVFAVFDIVFTVIGKVVGVIANLLGYATEGSDSFLQFAGNVGDWLVNLDKAVKSGTGLTTFFDGLEKVLKLPLAALKQFGSGFAAVFAKIEQIDFAGIGQKIKAFFEPIKTDANILVIAWQVMVIAFKKIVAYFTPLASKVYAIFQKLAGMIGKAMGKFDAQSILGLTGVGALTVVGNMLSRFIKTFGKYVEDTVGLGSTIQTTFLTLTKNLQIMQASLQADILLKIAKAIALLAVSAALLSTIDPVMLAASLGAMGAMLKGLLIALAQFDEVTNSKGMSKIAVLSGALMVLAGAIFILSIALKIMSTMSWEELARGLVGMAGGLGIIAGAMQLMPKDLAVRSAGLTGIAFAIGLLAISMKIMASMSWEELAKGLGGMAGALLIVAGAIRLMPKDLAARSAGLIAIGVALIVIAAALKIVSGISWEGLLKGLLGLGGALVVISGAMGIMPKDMAAKAVGLAVVGVALLIISKALQSMGGMSWEEIAKGLVTLAGALLIIGIAVNAMQGAILGAAAIAIVAVALNLLAPVLLAFGNMSLEQIGTALLMLAGTFVVLGVAAAVLTPLIPSLLGLGAAIALIGAGVALAGVGVLALSVGLTALGAAGTIGAAGIVAIVSAVAGLAPMIGKALGETVVAIIDVFANSTNTFISAAVSMLMTLLTAIDIVAPKAVDTLFNLISLLVDKITTNVPKFVDAGMRMINGILKGIRDHIKETVKLASDIVVEFINGIAEELPKITDSAANLVITFVNSVADTIRNKSTELGTAGGNIASALVEGMAKGTLAGVGRIADAAASLANTAINTIKDILHIKSPSKVLYDLGVYAGEGFYYGLLSMSVPVLDTVSQTINAMRDKLAAGVEDTTDSITSLQADAASVQQNIADLEKDIKSLNKKKKKTKADKKKLAADKKALAENKAKLAQDNKDLADQLELRNKLTGAQEELNVQVAAHQDQLMALTDQYNDIINGIDGVSIGLTQAKQALTDAQKAMTDAQASYKSKYATLPAFSDEGDLVNQYITALQTQVSDTQTFMDKLALLRGMGLDDATYRKLADAGLDALPFVEQLLTSGQDAVDAVNKMDTELDSVAKNLGDNIGSALYQAGVDSAQGIVDGLQSQADAIAAQMVDIANTMVAAIERRLGIASPSKVLSEVGGYAMSGLMNGLQKQLPALANMSEGMGDNIISGLQSSLSDISDSLDDNLDLTPTIRPVLDLGDIEAKSALLNSMMANQKSMKVDTSYSRAAYLSRYGSMAGSTSQEAVAYQGAGTVVNFTQNNNSPKAISDAEIYRQTKNGISSIKKVVAPA